MLPMTSRNDECDLLKGHISKCPFGSTLELYSEEDDEQIDLDTCSVNICTGINEPPKLPIRDQIHLYQVIQRKDELEFSVFEFQRRLDVVQNNLVRMKQDIAALMQEQSALQATLDAAESEPQIAAISLEKVDKHKMLMELISQEDCLLNELEGLRKSLSCANVAQQSFALKMGHQIDEMYRIHCFRKDYEFSCRLHREKIIRQNAVKSRQKALEETLIAEENYVSQRMAFATPKPGLEKGALNNLRALRKKTLDEVISKKKLMAEEEELRKTRQMNNILRLKRELDDQQEMRLASSKLRRELALEEEKALIKKRQEIIAAGGNPFMLERLAEKERAERIAEKKRQDDEGRVMLKLINGVRNEENAKQRKRLLREELEKIWAAKAKEKRFMAKRLEDGYLANLNSNRACAELDLTFIDAEEEGNEMLNLGLLWKSMETSDNLESAHKPIAGNSLVGDETFGEDDNFKDSIVEKPRKNRPNCVNCFKAIPEEVIFKDFDLGKTYRKKVIISNRSNQRLRFFFREFIDLGPIRSDATEGPRVPITDVIKVTFDTPPPLFPGLTHEFYLNFSPNSFESWTGELQFESPVGAFKIPVKCLQKQFDPSLSMEFVRFADVITGTISTVKVKVTNQGSLPGMVVGIRKVDPNRCHSPAVLCSDSEMLTSDIEFPLNDGNDKVKSKKPKGKKRSKKKRKRKCKICIGQEDVLREDEAADEMPLELPAIRDVFDVTIEGSYSTILANGDLTLKLVFEPEVSGQYSQIYKIDFDNPDIIPLKLCLEGTSINNPFVADPMNVNFNICIINLLYQQPIEIRNLSKSRGKIIAKVPSILKPFVEVIPKSAQSNPGASNLFSVKFNPRYDLLDRVHVQQVFDASTKILDFSVSFLFENFSFETPGPLICTFQAILDEVQIQVFPESIDFGSCSTCETVKKKVTIRNIGAVSQDFGFVELPEWITVQPNYGFGTLIPGESRMLEVLVSPTPAKAGKQSTTLKLRTLTNNYCAVSVKALGKVSAAALTFSHITFPVTCVGSSISAMTELYIKGTKSRTQRNSESMMALPGAIIRFQFFVNAIYPIEVTPNVGTIEHGKGQKLLITFKADLSTEVVRKHYPRLLEKKFEENRENILLELTRINEILTQIHKTSTNSIVQDGSGDARILQNKKHLKSKRNSAKRSAGSGSARKSVPSQNGDSAASPIRRRSSGLRPIKVLGPATVTTLDDLQLLKSSGQVEIPLTQRKELELRQEFLEYALGATLVPAEVPDISVEGIDYMKTRRELLKEVTMHSDTFTVPCRLTLADGKQELLFLTLKCPIQKPDFVILDDWPELTFGSVQVGSSVIGELNLHNTSIGTLNLKMETVNSYGPFTRLNALRPVAPNLVFTLRIKFSPMEEGDYKETVVISGGESRIPITLKGRGVPGLST